jgi:signal transduction histidine kinase/ligand-binding sensor domain-containing protein
LRSSNFSRKPPQRLRTSRRWLMSAVAAWLILVRPTYGMDPNRAMSQYLHDKWGADQGFPVGPVYAITQAADGYLWIGTDAGLVRFDGWNFRVIKDDSRAFTIGSVLGLTSDDEGCLWIRLQDLTIVRYCRGVFERPSADAEKYTSIEAMSRANHGELLVWKAEYGAFSLRRGSFQKRASAVDLPRSPVISLAQTRNGDVYMGTRDGGLFRNTGGNNLQIRNGLPDLKVNCLLPDGDDVWVGTDQGIVRWNGSKLTSIGFPASLNRFQALVMVRDRDANIWVGTDSKGLLRFNSQGFASLREGDNLSSEAVTALFEDREGNLWMGHAGGIERLRDSAFVTYSSPEGLPTEGGNPVFVDSEDRMWFPPVSGGLWWVKGGQHGRVTNGGLDRDVVYSLAGGKGELWAGRQRGGLTQLRYGTNAFETRTYTQSDGLAQDSIYSVYRTRDGTVWAGTLSAGVSMLRDGQFTNYTVEQGLASNTVASILEGSDGTMWFATPSGLSALLNGAWRSYGIADGLPSENVNALLEDSTGAVWAGTASGIAFRGRAGFQVPSGLPAALRGQILGLAEDKYGWLWMATSNHVLRVKRDALMRGAVDEGDVREYGLADGLRGVEGVKRHQSVFADPMGRIWFSLNRGISVVDPARLTRNSAPAIVHVETITTDGRAIPIGSAAHVPGGRQRIAFGYVGLSLSVPDRVRYRYLLEGFDPAWSDPVAIREAVYTNLSPGSYRFRLIASNPDGVWSSEQASITFEVAPLFWQTWWFRASAVLAFGGIILAFYRFRLHQLTRRLNLRFEERLAERTRIAQELHDTLLQGFLSASMQVHVAVDGLPQDSPVKPILTRALQLMRQVVEEGRNAVRGLRSSGSVSHNLEHVFSRVQQELVPDAKGGEQIGFRVIVEGQQQPLHPLLRDDVYRIGREALINAFRHARAKNIEVELKYSPSHLRILVRDDGCGIEPQILTSGRDGHWGLSGMRERAEQIGARLHVYSSATAGTEVELSVPGHVAFEGHSSRGLWWFGKRNTKDRYTGYGSGERQ